MNEEILEPILRKLRIGVIESQIPQGAILCDVGCGRGDFLKLISGHISQGFGFDKKAVESQSGNITIKRQLLDQHLPLESGSVNCVTLLAVLEHLENPDSIMEECHRILKPDGIIIITTPAPVSKPVLEFLSFRLGIVSPEEIRDHKHYYSKKELCKILEMAGFKGIAVRSFEFGFNNMVTGIKE